MPKDLGVHGGVRRNNKTKILRNSEELSRTPFVQVSFASLAAALTALEDVVERFGPLERTSRIRP
jgi:hypothetical protein